MDELAKSRWNQRRTLLAFCVMLPLALAYFGIRGPMRAVEFRQFNDFLSPYIQTKAWLRGQDPYDPRVVARLWPAETDVPAFVRPESENGTLPARRGIPSPYPLTGFPLLAPLAMMPWPSASLVWFAISTLSFVTIVISTLAVARVPMRSTQAGAIVLCALMLAPFHTAIALGNLVLVVFALGMLAWLNVGRGSDVWAGLLLAAGAALKPTVALPFLICFAAMRRWRTLTIALAAGLALFLIADLRILSAGVHWAHSYLPNSQRMFAPGGIDDFTSGNPTRFDLLNLQVILYQVTRSTILSQVFAWMIAAGLLLRWAIHYRKMEGAEASLFNLAVVGTISLLPFYHRFYDGCLLLFPLAWAVTQVRGRQRKIARNVLIVAVPFALPGAAVLQALAGGNSILHDLAQKWWWQFLIAPHQVWIILAMAVLLLAAQAKTAAADSVESFNRREGNMLRTRKPTTGAEGLIH